MRLIFYVLIICVFALTGKLYSGEFDLCGYSPNRPNIYYVLMTDEIIDKSNISYAKIPRVWRFYIDSLPIGINWQACYLYDILSEEEKKELARLIVEAVDREYEMINESWRRERLYAFDHAAFDSYINLRVLPYIRKNTTNKNILNLIKPTYINVFKFWGNSENEHNQHPYWQDIAIKSFLHLPNIESVLRIMQNTYSVGGEFFSYLHYCPIYDLVTDYFVARHPHDKRGWDFVWFYHGGDGENFGIFDIEALVNQRGLQNFPYGKQIVELAKDDINRFGDKVALRTIDPQDRRIETKKRNLPQHDLQQLATLIVDAANWEYETLNDFWRAPKYYSFPHDQLNSYLNLLILPHIRKYANSENILNKIKTKTIVITDAKTCPLKGNPYLYDLTLHSLFLNRDYEQILHDLQNIYADSSQPLSLIDGGIHTTDLHSMDLIQVVLEHYIQHNPHDKRAWDFLWHFSRTLKPETLEKIIGDHNLQNNGYAAQIIELLKNPKNRVAEQGYLNKVLLPINP